MSLPSFRTLHLHNVSSSIISSLRRRFVSVRRSFSPLPVSTKTVGRFVFRIHTIFRLTGEFLRKTFVRNRHFDSSFSHQFAPVLLSYTIFRHRLRNVLPQYVSARPFHAWTIWIKMAGYFTSKTCPLKAFSSLGWFVSTMSCPRSYLPQDASLDLEQFRPRPFRPRNVLKAFRPGRFVSEGFQTRPFPPQKSFQIRPFCPWIASLLGRFIAELFQSKRLAVSSPGSLVSFGLNRFGRNDCPFELLGGVD